LCSSLLWNRKQIGYQVPKKLPKEKESTKEKSKKKKESENNKNKNKNEKRDAEKGQVNMSRDVEGKKRRNVDGGSKESKSRATTTTNPERIRRDGSRVHAQRSATHERSGEKKVRRAAGAAAGNGEGNGGRRKVRSTEK